MKKSFFITSAIVAAAVLITVSCATTKGSQRTGAGSQTARNGEAGSGAAPSTDDAVDQKAVVSSDGTVAEMVPHVDSTTKKAAAPSESADSSSDEAASDEATVEQTVKETAEEKAARLAAEKAKKAANQKAAAKKKAAEKIEKQKRKDNYTGWVYIPKKNFTVTNGDIQLTMRGSTGSFELYAIPETGKPLPLLATYDEFCSTFFSLMIGRKEYRLNSEAGVKSEARKTEYGAQMAYTVPNKAQIVVDFSFMPSIATSTRVDLVRDTVYTIDLGKSTQSFTVKGVFDTMLGENTVTHFSTAAHRRINSEVQYTDMAAERWIRSENERASIQFLLNGKGITAPRAVTLGNKDLLSGSTWLPVAEETRSFSSVLAYNNSAMSINWKTAYLDPMKTDVITFYISVATDGNELAGKEFLATLAAGKTALPSNLPNTVQKTAVAPAPASVSAEETASAYHENMPAISGVSTLPSTATAASTGAVLDTEASADTTDSGYSNTTAAPTLVAPSTTPVQPDAQPATATQSASSYTPAPTPLATVQDSKPYTGSYPLSSVTKAQLDPEYIQNLLDRIADLESDPALVDKGEVKRLNDELDAILAVIRSTN